MTQVYEEIYEENLERVERAEEGSILYRFIEECARILQIKDPSHSNEENWYDAQKSIAARASRFWDGQAFSVESGMSSWMDGVARMYNNIYHNGVEGNCQRAIEQISVEIVNEGVPVGRDMHRK